jgi:hypothetical protein
MRKGLLVLLALLGGLPLTAEARSITIHYPWHPRYGRTLSVDGERVTALTRERILCTPRS